MKRFYRLFLAGAALVLLTIYFFADLSLTGGPEMMTWEEFSADSGAVAKFRERLNTTEAGAHVTDADVRCAYEAHVARVSSGRGNARSDGRVAAFKSGWHAVYRALAIGGRGRTGAGSARRTAPAVRERVGMMMAVVLLSGGVIVLTVADRLLETKGRA